MVHPPPVSPCNNNRMVHGLAAWGKHAYLSYKSGPPTTLQVQYKGSALQLSYSLRGASESNILQGISVRGVTILKQSSKLMRSRGDHNICWRAGKSGPGDCTGELIFGGTDFVVTVLSCKKWVLVKSDFLTDFGKN